MKKLTSRAVLAVILMFGILGCTSQKQIVHKEDLGFTAPGNLKHEALIVFYRKGGSKADVPTVWLENRIVGALMPNQYAQSWACPRRVTIHIENGSDIAKHSIIAPKGEILYLEVYKKRDGTFGIKKTKGMSKNIISRSDAMNRYKPYCGSEYIELNADTLFAFNRSTLSSEGKSTIDALAKKLKTEYFNIKKIRIEGHTDRIGTNEYNDKLSEARAKTVANRLKRINPGVYIEATGRGERYPITRGCLGDTPTAELIECLAPDRRVSVEIIGIQNDTH
ncbi:OmpA family protein [Sulfurovum mangrovi]|uniref:OmpA family protein n=1 Tax=Sulfurovum mangrovi TaxID=2893889 RepID=UPI00384EA6FC